MRGKAAEDAAAAYLEAQGLLLVARNWRCRGGEIDLICRHGNHLVFVECGHAAEVTSAAPRPASQWPSASA